VAEYRVVEHDRDLSDLVERGRDQPRYAIDTEFHRERTYFPQLALVQLAWPGELVIVDPLAVDISRLAPLLEGPGLAVLHAADQDLEVLTQACGVLPHRIWDTQLAAGFLGMSTPSLASLHEQLLGHSLPKGDRLTDWLRRPLRDSQLQYAASDVAELLEIHTMEEERLRDAGRLDWVEVEFERALDNAKHQRDPQQAWTKIKHARQLKGPARAAARALAAWREERAAELDRPTRFVLADMALVGIAQARPRSGRELERIRGVDSRSVPPKIVDELLAVVAAAADADEPEPDERPTPEMKRELRPLATLVSAWLSQRARELGVDTSLLATRADIEALLRGDEGARLAHGWRAEVVGEPIGQLMHGEAALAFDGRGGLVLEARSRRSI
jgi:ribonuclease D